MKKSRLLGAVCATVFSFIPISSHTAPVFGQGTWETTLRARDLDSNPLSIEAYYDTTLDITWVVDANLAFTSGYDADGRMAWTDANDWASNLSINGVTGWRLPTVSPLNGASFDVNRSTDGSTDNGTATTTTVGPDGGWRDASNNPVSEMGHMYYVTLGTVARCSPDYNDRCVEQPGYGLSNTGPFSIDKISCYWTGLETGTKIGFAWNFCFANGKQGSTDGIAFAWLVHDGDVGTPIPK